MGKVWDKGALITKNPEDLLNLFDVFQCSRPIHKSFEFSRVNGDAILIQLHSQEIHFFCLKEAFLGL